MADYIIQNGPLVKTQDVRNIYLQTKNLKNTYRKRSCEYYELFSRHLNLIQIYIFGTGYLLPNTTINVERFIQEVKGCINEEEIVQERISDRLSDIFSSCLKYMDTHRDRQAVKALFAELTSVRFATKLQGLKSRQGTASAKKALQSGLHRFEDIRKTSQTVRSDLTLHQQYRLMERIISRRKPNELRTIARGRGRKLKAEQFPQLGIALEYAFGEIDLQMGGGGLEAHPRLTTGTLYRGADSVTAIRHAREVLLSMAPEGFTISLRSCYNYTENYKEGTQLAERHHAGLGVNGNISLKKPPRTGVQQLVINLHWSSCNVNNIIDTREGKNSVISKDAKTSIPSDSSPVQLPGHSWKKLEYPDHTWDQSRTNDVLVFGEQDYRIYNGESRHDTIFN